jgi:uncharacterized membrane-anchored protein YhcB (DUF1043 family)
MFLQTTQIHDSVQNLPMQYGVIGLVAVILGYFAWNQYTRLLKKNEELEEKVDHLQNEMMGLIIEQKDQLVELVNSNTEALKDLHKLVLEFVIRGNKDHH